MWYYGRVEQVVEIRPREDFPGPSNVTAQEQWRPAVVDLPKLIWSEIAEQPRKRRQRGTTGVDGVSRKGQIDLRRLLHLRHLQTLQPRSSPSSPSPPPKN